MKTLSLYEAKTHLSRVITHVEESGETYVISRNGKPMAKIVPIEPVEKLPRLGFMRGEISVPDDFNDLGRDEIADLFSSK